jgi:hypothetical protein
VGKQTALGRSIDPDDAQARAWRREQMDISNDFAGLPRDPGVDALMARLDLMELTDEEYILALTQYFTGRAAAAG